MAKRAESITMDLFYRHKTTLFLFYVPAIFEAMVSQVFLKFCTLVGMGYFLTNILVYGFLFALVVMGYNAIREMKNKK